MRQLFTLIMLLTTSTLMAQKYSGNVTPLKPETFEMIIFPFGMVYPLEIGSVDKNGQAQVNLDSIDMSHIPEDVKTVFLNRVTDNFFSSCDDPKSLGISGEIKAQKCGTPFLWQNNEQAGVVPCF